MSRSEPRREEGTAQFAYLGNVTRNLILRKKFNSSFGVFVAETKMIKVK